jgi:tetratricopeptide (TPR) repeat protein
MRTLVCFATAAAMLSGALALGVAAIRPTFVRFASLVPDNYRALAQEAVANQDVAQAERIVRRRIEQEYYDFDARYLHARILQQSGQFGKSISVLSEIFPKAAAARGREVGASGYDEGLTYKLLAESYWNAGFFITAGEMFRAATDAGAANCIPDVVLPDSSSAKDKDLAAFARGAAWLKSGNRKGFEKEQSHLAALTSSQRAISLRSALCFRADRTSGDCISELKAALSSFPNDPMLAVQRHAVRGSAFGKSALQDLSSATAGLRILPLDRFRLPPGGALTSDTISLSRNGSMSGQFDTGVFRVTNLLLVLSGSEAMGMWPAMTILSDGTELGRAYADTRLPQPLMLPIWPNGAPKSLNLEIRYDNDASDPVSKEDRNVFIHFAALY